MNKNHHKEPLFRKVNTRARNVRHNSGGEYKNTRHSKRETLEQVNGSMHGKKERGLDYTPLFKFLLLKVGSDWNDVFSEAKSRLNKVDLIFWLVALHINDREDVVRIGEASYFSGFYVDDDGILQLSNPNLDVKDLKHYCDCCTHTFNGIVY